LPINLAHDEIASIKPSIANTMKKQLIEIVTVGGQAREALEALRKDAKPGEVVFGGKNDLLRFVRPEIVALLADGYTVRQIVETLETINIKVPPKLITQVANESSPPKPRVRPAKKSAPRKRPIQSLKAPASPSAPGATPAAAATASNAGKA
jgi:hypothetical protein